CLFLAQFGDELPPAHARLQELPGHDHGEQAVAAPNVEGVVELRDHVFPFAVSCPITRPIQFLRRSCSIRSLRARSSSAPPNISLTPTVIQISGDSMLECIRDSPSRRIVAPWCRVVHHSTEKWISGILTSPTSTRMQATRAPLRRSSKAA